MQQPAIIAFLLFALVAIGAILAVFVNRHFQRTLGLTTHADSVCFAQTSDGHRVALYRYQPQQPRVGELPVVLCHGLAANRFNLDFDEQYSLARYLKGRGYDVFVVEMRPASDRYSFDDLVERDIPAILDEIQTITGAAKVNWVGHSLGGIVAYAALAGSSQNRIHALATLGTPATFAHSKWLRRLARAYALVRYAPPSASLLLARFYATWSFVPLPLTSVFLNRKNMEPHVLRKTLWNVVSASSPPLVDQLVGAVRAGTPVTVSGQADREAHFRAMKHPILMIAGQGDRLIAPPAAVRHAFYTAASDQKELIVLSKQNGYSADYGHGDLILGKNAPTEVFPIVERFLWKHRREQALPFAAVV